MIQTVVDDPAQHDSKLVRIIISTYINWVLITSLLRGLELATFVVDVVEVLLEVFLEECVVNRKLGGYT